jgi:hypothetical protein
MKRLTLVIAAGCLVGLLPAPAFAQAPANDLIRNATTIPSVPFSVQQDASESHTDGPRGCSNIGSVFYRFRPQTTMRLQADTIGSDYDTVLTIFRGPLRNLQIVRCNDDRVQLASAIRFRAQAGVRYIFMIAACCGTGPGSGGQLEFSLAPVPTAPLEVTAEITGATVDAVSGDIEVTGTATCNQRAVVFLEGTVRQVRGDVFVARGSFFDAFLCVDVADWSFAVSPEGDIAFGPGNARFRYFVAGDTGFSSFFSGEIVEVIALS